MQVERIKERVEEKEGIPPQQQRLIYSGKQMWVPPSWTILLRRSCRMLLLLHKSSLNRLVLSLSFLGSFASRNDEKTAADYKIQGGSVLHLVLALRGGSTLQRPCTHLSSLSWVAVVMVPAECQRFRCLSQSNHVTAQRSEIPRSRADANSNKNQPTTAKKRRRKKKDVLIPL